MLLTFSITVVILDYQTPQPCGIVSLSSGHVDAARTIQCAQCMVLLRSSNDDRNSTMHCSSVCSLHFVACRVASRRTFHLTHILLFITFSVEPLQQAGSKISGKTDLVLSECIRCLRSVRSSVCFMHVSLQS